MPVIVQKYGGSSVATPEKIREVASRISKIADKGNKIVVVVSAMGKTTDELLDLAKKVDPQPSERELDMLLSVGERITMSLLCMALQRLGRDAISLTGSQCGIITNDAHYRARIIEMRPVRVQDELDRNRIVVIAGYQGMSYKREITTLGRGGSDTTAVALAAALGAEYCEICSDVDGVYSADPKVVHKAIRLDEIGYEVMQEMSESGARVLAADAVEFAKKSGIALYLRSAKGEGGTVVRKMPLSSLNRVAGITHEDNVMLLEGRMNILEDLLSFLDDKGLCGKQLVLFSETGMGDGMVSLLLSAGDTAKASNGLTEILDQEFGDDLLVRNDLGAVSLLGEGINTSHANFRRAIDLLRKNKVEPLLAGTSRFRITFLVETVKVHQVTRLLHDEFIGLYSNNGSSEIL
ncbi:MAG: aspartate kinase [Deltaproteobacteria bacterium]|nr:aspartate kinase [Deltaproteobacteria bacterium]